MTSTLDPSSRVPPSESSCGNDNYHSETKDPEYVFEVSQIQQQQEQEQEQQQEQQQHLEEYSTVVATPNGSSNNFLSKLTWLEVSGACGDFGTLFPLLVALARQRKIHLAPTFLITGLCHVLTGWYWNLPMPLQPMHMISAQALADALETPTQVSTAGVGMGISFLVLQFGGIEWLHRCIPKSVIGGLQLGVGWKVALKGLKMIQTQLPWWGRVDCIVTAIVVSALTLYGLRPSSTSSRNIVSNNSQLSAWQRLWHEPPMGLYLFGMGLVLAALQLLAWNENGDDDGGSSNIDLHLQPEPLLRNALQHATLKDWSVGLTSGTLPQLPLTTLNSCLSVCLLAETLFPQQGSVVSRKSVCWSIGLMNAIGCPLGMLPHCHGAGGLAGQVRLGASSGVSMMGLGIFKLLLSLWAAQGSLLLVLDALPVSVLGVLLALSGHELALTGIKAVIAQYPGISSTTPQRAAALRLQQQQDIGIALVTAVVIVGTGMAHVGALCGWFTYLIHGNGMEELFGWCWRSNDDHGNDGRRGTYSHVATDATDE